MNEKKRYSDEELQEFKAIIKDKLIQAEIDYERLKDVCLNNRGNRTDDTSPKFKPYDESAETLSKELNTSLAHRQEKFIRDLKLALQRIENKTYGICRDSGKLIEKERLKIVPHATLSVESKIKKNNLK